MKKLVAFALYFILIAATRESGFKLSPAISEGGEVSLEQATDYYNNSLQTFEQSIEALIQCVSEAPAEDIRTHCGELYRSMRDDYKKLELLLDYRDHEAVHMFLNGAPLLSLEPHVPEIIVIEPEGMQVVDEIMYLEPDSPVEADGLVVMLEQMHDRMSMVRNTDKVSSLKHHHVWNGMRLNMIRVYTLGLTGFDTPGSLMALEDAVASFSAMAEYYSFYSPLVAKKDADLDSEIKVLMEKTVAEVQAAEDFNAFDRLGFLKNRLNPLFAKTLQAQRKLGVALPYETNDDLPAINLAVSNLFDPALFNMDYYTNMDWSAIPDAKIHLGRTLFFDPILSSNMKMSCASCHDPKKAFTDGYKKSISNDGETTVARNAPTLMNCVYSEKFFLDLREDHLERQIKHVVLDSKEFAIDFLKIVERLKQSSEYQSMFAEAYPNSPYQLSKWSVSDALAAYVASLTSFDSDVDKFIRDEIAEVSPEVYRGYNVFMGKGACGTCHFAPTFNGTVPPVYQHSESEVLGVPASTDTVNPQIDPDPGRIANSKPTDESEIYLHAFKTTTVRNVALTAPYMHNGVYETLEEVIDFYNVGGGLGLGIDVPNQTLPGAALDLTEQEVSDLVAFMEALTDVSRFQEKPAKLPEFDQNEEWNTREVGGLTQYN